MTAGPQAIVISPRSRDRAEVAAAPARLAATMLEVAVAGSAESGRFRRGREYVAEGAVRGLVVSPGELLADVTGSRAWTYEVEIRVPVDPASSADPNTAAGQMALIPDPDDMWTTCSCPDVEDPCKHAVAALLAFAAEVADRPALLTTWRGARAERKAAGSRAAAAQPAPPPEQAPLWESPEWVEFLGAGLAPPDVAPPAEPAAFEPSKGHEVIGDVDLAALVDDARRALVDPP